MCVTCLGKWNPPYPFRLSLLSSRNPTFHSNSNSTSPASLPGAGLTSWPPLSLRLLPYAHSSSQPSTGGVHSLPPKTKALIPCSATQGPLQGLGALSQRALSGLPLQTGRPGMLLASLEAHGAHEKVLGEEVTRTGWRKRRAQPGWPGSRLQREILALAGRGGAEGGEESE